MRVRSVKMEGFTSHRAETVVHLPETGLVLVTGPNGAGKSSLVEAVAWCLWGETLRGTAPFLENVRCAVHVVLQMPDGDLEVLRTRRSGKTTLSWLPPGTEALWVEYDTAAKAQEALDPLVGSGDVWRRSHAFSSSDASHFTSATDGERKRLLEEMLGLGRFDAALEACRGDLRRADRSRESTSSALVVHEQRAGGVRQRIEDARRTLADAGHSGSYDAGDLDALREDLRSIDIDVRQLRAQVTQLSGQGQVQASQATALARRLSNLQGRSACDACGQVVTPALLESMTQDVGAARLAAEHARDASSAQLRAAQEAESERSDERAALDSRLRRAESEQQVSRRVASVREQAQKVIDQSTQNLVDIEAQLAALRADHGKAQAEHAVLNAAEGVLGMRGVRAHVLGAALGGLEAVANSWLAKLAGENLRLKIRPYTDKKSGGTSDAISVDVVGAGGGLGYAASSGGERRRVDVAVMLALAEVSAAAAGRQPGTLFADEVFDAVDTAGVPLVADALRSMSHGRAVVVVTHSETLARVLKPDLHLRVDAGRVEVAGNKS